MDSAVALVQSYLHVNGYFTVAEYPVLEALREGTPRRVTDVDGTTDPERKLSVRRRR
jgi:hypothetical protein